MANSKRQDILNNIQTTLEGVSSLNTVIMHQPYEVDRDTLYLPSASVWTLSEVESTQTPLNGVEIWDWVVGVEVWFYADATNQETLLKEVNDAIYVDSQRGGCAVDTKRIAIDHFEVFNDRSTNIKGFSIQFRIIYYHDHGVM